MEQAQLGHAPSDNGGLQPVVHFVLEEDIFKFRFAHCFLAWAWSRMVRVGLLRLHCLPSHRLCLLPRSMEYRWGEGAVPVLQEGGGVSTQAERGRVWT